MHLDSNNSTHPSCSGKLLAIGGLELGFCNLYYCEHKLRASNNTDWCHNVADCYHARDLVAYHRRSYRCYRHGRTVVDHHVPRDLFHRQSRFVVDKKVVAQGQVDMMVVMKIAMVDWEEVAFGRRW